MVSKKGDHATHTWSPSKLQNLLSRALREISQQMRLDGVPQRA